MKTIIILLIMIIIIGYMNIYPDTQYNSYKTQNHESFQNVYLYENIMDKKNSKCFTIPCPNFCKNQQLICWECIDKKHIPPKQTYAYDDIIKLINYQDYFNRQTK
jgi:hypothetical protein